MHVAFTIISQNIKLFWAQICIALKKVLKEKSLYSVKQLLGTFLEIPEREAKENYLWGIVTVAVNFCAYTLIHLIKLFKRIMGCKTRDTE